MMRMRWETPRRVYLVFGIDQPFFFFPQHRAVAMRPCSVRHCHDACPCFLRTRTQRHFVCTRR
jgi:hypothetical protein